VAATNSAVAALAARVDALERAPKNAQLRTEVAVTSMQTGDFAGALRHAERVVQENPRMVSAYVPLATATALTTPATAHVPYERMAAIVPEGPPLAAAGLADLALFQGRPADAVAILEPAITHQAHMKGALLANQYMTLAEAQAGLGQPDDALAAVDRALDNSRTDGILLPAARLLLELEHEPAAAALARELQTRATAEARAYAVIVDAEIALRHDDAEKAITSLRTLIAEQDLWLAHFALGNAYLQAGRDDDAEAEFEICHLRRGEAAMLFDDLPTLRYLRKLP
jgi:tetratricopeptide (TPR) repeat protein